MSEIFWLPLESNPEAMNNYLDQLGVPTKWGISDILSLDEEFLPFVSQPVLAVILLFPVPENYREICAMQEKILNPTEQNVDSEVYFMNQTIRNACGTMALIHAIANCRHELNLNDDSVISKFFKDTIGLPSKEKAKILEQNEEISVAHETCAKQGQTQTPNLGDKCSLHFVSFVQVNSTIYEFDGCKSNPVVHGSTSPDTFLQDAARVCRDYMARDPDNVNFTALSLGAL